MIQDFTYQYSIKKYPYHFYDKGFAQPQIIKLFYHLIGFPAFFHCLNSDAAVNNASVEEFKPVSQES